MPTRFAKPIIKVYLLPADWTEEQYLQYFKRLVFAASSVNALRVQSEKDLIILFPKDAMTYGLGTEIVIEIDLPASFARNEDIENEAVSAIFQVTQETFPKAYVQCKVYKFDTEHGYWASGMDDEATLGTPTTT